MPVASCIPFPFFVPCNDMLVMLFCATHWLYVHLYSHVYMFMHESCLLVCRPYFNTMRLWTFDLNLHLSLTNTTFCLLSCLFTLCLLFVILLVYPFAHMFAHILYAMLVIAILLARFAPFCYYLCISPFPLLVYWFLVFAFACTHGARERSPRCKQKGHGCKLANMN